MNTHTLKHRTCYHCGIAQEPDYLTMFDLGTDGRELVDVCDDCRAPVINYLRIIFGLLALLAVGVFFGLLVLTEGR